MGLMSLDALAYRAIAAIITITVHEFIKALISSSLGDPLPKRDKRVTLNPLSHLEPIGFIIMVALGFGWGKPVDTASIYYKDRRNGTLMTYIIPSAANLILGVIFALVMTLSKASGSLWVFLYTAALYNMRHALFNIIPVYPLDGAKVLSVIRDPNKVISMVNNQMFYQLALILFIVWGIVGRIIDPICGGIIGSIAMLYR